MQNNHGKNSWDGRLRKKGSGEHQAESAASHWSPSPAVCCVALPHFTQTSLVKAKKKQFTYRPWPAMPCRTFLSTVEESGNTSKQRAREQHFCGPGVGVPSGINQKQIKQHPENYSNGSLDKSAGHQCLLRNGEVSKVIMSRQDATMFDFQQKQGCESPVGQWKGEPGWASSGDLLRWELQQQRDPQKSASPKSKVKPLLKERH